MGQNSKLYLANNITINELVNAIKTEFATTVDTSSVKFEKKMYDGDFDRHYGYIRFKSHSIFYYEFNMSSANSELDNTNPHVLSMYASDENVEVLSQIVKYFGGRVVTNDCSDDEPVYVKQEMSLKNELSIEDKLVQLINSKFNLTNSEEILQFIKENKEIINQFYSL